MDLTGMRLRRPERSIKTNVRRISYLYPIYVEVPLDADRQISFDIEQPLVDAVFPDLPRTPPGEETGSRLRLQFLKRIDAQAFATPTVGVPPPLPHGKPDVTR